MEDGITGVDDRRLAPIPSMSPASWSLWDIYETSSSQTSLNGGLAGSQIPEKIHPESVSQSWFEVFRIMTWTDFGKQAM